MIKDDCIFCSIANGKIPTGVVYEDDVVMAFEDANPQMPVHVLIVPKQHFDNIGDNIPEDILGHMFATVKKVADIKGIAHAGQVVHHVHVHVLGGAPMNDGNPSAR